MNSHWKQYQHLLSAYLKPLTGKVTLLCVLLLAGIGMQLAMPQLIRTFIDTASGHGSLHKLAHLAWIYLLVGLCNQLATAGTGYLGTDVGWIATNRLRVDLALHCLQLDMPFHNARTPGEMIERIDGDVNSLATFFSSLLVNVLGNALLLIGAMVLFFVKDWRMGLVQLLLAAVSLAVLLRMRGCAVDIFEQERETTANMMGFLEERLGGIDDIRANGIGAYTMAAFARIARKRFHAGRRGWLARNRLWSVVTICFTVGTLLTLGLCIYLIHVGAITLGTAYMFYQYNVMLCQPLEQLTRQMQDLQRATASIQRISQLFAETPSITDGHAATLPSGALAVEFDDVTFAYHEDLPVLQGLSFRLAPGRVLGVLGRTGSGKTTMMRLLFRLYDVQQGHVRVGGADLHDLRLADLRRHIGMVTQEVQLFHASVRDNLTFFDRDIPDARILQVVEELGLQEWLERLPEGLDTLLHADGAGLSAGESQLLAFTRIFLADPGLVLMDEPSSRLDPATERLIEHAVNRLLHGRTCIIIAHRLNTVRRADDILIIDEGRVLEHGLRAELAETPTSRFAQLLATGMEKELV